MIFSLSLDSEFKLLYMFYEIEVLEKKIILSNENETKVIFNKDIKVVKVVFVDDLKAKFLLLFLFLSVLTAFFLKMNIGLYEAIFILCLLSDILFFEFEKRNANLTIVTKNEKIKFRVDSENFEQTFEMIDRLLLKDYKASIGRVHVFTNVA